MSDHNSCSWNDITQESLNSLVTRQMIRTPLITVVRVNFKKGASFPGHQHVHEQLTMVETGKMKIEIGGHETLLEAGDMLRVPPNAFHYTEALEDSSTLEIFSPARDDIPCPENAWLKD